MELNIEATRNTPFVRVSAQDGTFEIRGKSHGEDSLGFFRRILESLRALVPATNEFDAHFFLEYFNTSSAKCLFDVMRALDQLRLKGVHVRVHWYYEEEDYDMIEIGEDYADLVNLEFLFEEVSTEEYEAELDKLVINQFQNSRASSKIMSASLVSTTR